MSILRAGEIVMADPRTKLVQIAAVCCAIVEDLDNGKSGWDYTWDAMSDVFSERKAQDAKWGPQHHSLAEWLMILAEEVGELAEATRADILTLEVEGTDTYVFDASDNLHSAGDWARKFIEGHTWPDYQQQVVDKEG
jgi:hypothetical protein